MDEQATLDLGKSRPRPIVVLRGQRGGHVLPQPVEMVVDEPAQTSSSVAAPGHRLGGFRPATLGMTAERREAERLVPFDEQPGPSPEVVGELVELGV